MSAKFPIIFSAEFRNAEETKAKIASLGGAMANFGEKSEQAGKQVQKTEGSFKTAALGFSAAASSVISLGFQFDDLQKKQLAIQKAQTAVSAATATVADTQIRLNKLVEGGKQGTEEYNAAILDLKVAQEREKNAIETLNIKQGDLSQAQVGFALQVVPTVISAVTSAITAHGALAAAHVATGTTAVGAGAGIRILKGALDFLMTNPILLIFAGIATVLTLIITNTFGWRDAIDEWAKSVEKALPFLKPVFDFFRGIADILSGKTTPAVKDASALMDESFSGIGSSATDGSEEVKKALDKIEKDTKDTAKNVESAVDKIKKAYESLKTPSIVGEGIGNPRPSAANNLVGEAFANPRANVVPQPQPVNPTTTPDLSRGILTGKAGDIFLAGAAGTSRGRIIVSIDEEGNLRFKDAQRNTYLNEMVAEI